MRNSVSFKFLLCCLCLGICFSCLTDVSIKAQQTCTAQNSPAIYNPGFPRGAEIQVYINTNITGTQVTAVNNAFSNWQSVFNNAGLTLKFVTSPPAVPPASGTYSWIVTHEAPIANVGLRAETHPSFDSNGRVQQAVTLIDPRVTADGAILDVMAHEIGHPLGLDDCPSCSATDSIMSAGNPRKDYWNGLSGRPTSPTPCDTQKLQTNYPTPTPNPTPSPTPGGGDDGCPCGDCINYCCNPGSANSDETESTANLNECGGGGDDECGWVEVPGQCYGGVAYGDCWDGYGSFDKYRDNCQYDPPHCDPDQLIWYCP